MSGDFFISPELLNEKLASPSLRLVDGSWYLPAMERNAKAEFEAGRIPGAQYFDIDAVADTSTSLPHMLPDPVAFAKAVGVLGISEQDEIVVYDGPGLFSSARVWWAFRTMGAQNVKILEGGFDRWKAKGFDVEDGEATTPEPAEFICDFAAHKVRDDAFIRANLKRNETLILDARPFGRFTGQTPEPREGLRSGHIPGSRSLPATDVVKDGALLPLKDLQDLLESKGVRPDIHVTTSCGSGVTAAILSLALETIGHQDHSLYDGSWSQWGALEDVPVARWE